METYSKLSALSHRKSVSYLKLLLFFSPTCVWFSILLRVLSLADWLSAPCAQTETWRKWGEDWESAWGGEKNSRECTVSTQTMAEGCVWQKVVLIMVFGVWECSMQLSSQEFAAFNGGTVSSYLNFGPCSEEKKTWHTSVSNICCTPITENWALINSSVITECNTAGLNGTTLSGASDNPKWKVGNAANWAGMFTVPISHPCVACRAPGRVAVVCRTVWYQAPGWHDQPAYSAPPSPVLDDYAVWLRQWRVLEGSGAMLG